VCPMCCSVDQSFHWMQLPMRASSAKTPKWWYRGSDGNSRPLLAAKTMRGLQDAQQHRRPNRANRREPFPGLLFLTLSQQISSHFLAQHPQRIELLVMQFRPPAHSRFADLPESLLPMTPRIHLLAGTRDGPTAIDARSLVMVR
jgi:hypothetical protein